MTRRPSDGEIKEENQQSTSQSLLYWPYTRIVNVLVILSIHKQTRTDSRINGRAEQPEKETIDFVDRDYCL